MNIIKYIYPACFLLVPFWLQAQAPVFYHISTAEGLGDNNVSTSAIDRNGILWIGTTEGLSSFDGNRIRSFDKYNYPALVDNDVDDIIVDKDNNIWLFTATASVSMMDKDRNFHLLTVGDSTDKEIVSQLFSTSKGMIALKGNRHYICTDYSGGEFKKMNFSLEKVIPSRPIFMCRLNGDQYLFYGNDRLVVIDYAAQKQLLNLEIKRLYSAAPINNDEFITYPIAGDVFYRVSISQGKIVKEYRDLRDQYNKPHEGNLRFIARIDEDHFAITSRFSGLYILDLRSGALKNYKHDPLDQRSIGGNNTFRIRYDSSGYLMVTTQTSGLHYYNVKQQHAYLKPYFKNERAEVFDGYIQCILPESEKIIWMGAQDRLIRWDREKDVSTFVPCYLPNGANLNNEETIRALQFDEQGNLLVGTTRYGILVLDKNFKTIRQLTHQSDSSKPSIPSPWINALCKDQNGNSWVATFRGVCLVRKDYSVKTFTEDPVLKKISGIHCVELWMDKQNRIWMGSRSGVYCYDPEKNQLDHYSTQQGLAHNIVYAINEDLFGNIYFGTLTGLSVLGKDGTIKTYRRGNGLRNDKCEGILRDENGNLWIGNLNCILRFDPASKSFAVFEEGNGFSHAGFRMRSCYKSEKGEMFWGSDKGLTLFFPNQMNREKLPLKPFIHALETPDSFFRFTAQKELGFSYNTKSFIFYFSSGELTGGKKSQVLCRLNGFEEDWKTPAAHGQVVYNNLPPGDYSFEIKASQDGSKWQYAGYPVLLTVNKPWWGQTWFLFLVSALVLCALYFLYRHYKVKREEKMARLKSKMEIMELNVKMAESRFSNLRLQMNPHFLFNSLSSIQHLIVSQQTTKAYKYLTLFSNFLRSLLNFAEKNFIPIDEELKILRMYIELESLRFDQSFSYEIKVDEGLTNEQVLLPTLMVQPFAENAIWHGLLHKKGEKKLSIRFSNSTEDYLTCIIEDNGIGRARSAEIEKNKISSTTHSSKGIGIIRERLNLMHQKTGKPASVEFTDKLNDKNEGTGTVVTITIPYYNPEAND